MRITIDIPDEIHARLKARAKAVGTTMRAIIPRAIENLLRADDAAPSTGNKARFPVISSKSPGTLRLGKDGVYEHIDFP
jgi:hypothetical protein